MNIILMSLSVYMYYLLFWSPKAQVRRLQKQIYRIPIKLARQQRRSGTPLEEYKELCYKSLEIRYKMLDALLDYKFDPKDNRYFIESVRENLYKYDVVYSLFSNDKNIDMDMMKLV